jgi:hypothetical protein
VPVAFAPQGKVTIRHAVQRIRDRLHPRAAQRAVIEMTNSGNEVPASYQEHCENEADAEERLRLALHAGDLVALTEDGGTVDSDYWRSGNAGMTLSFDKLYTRHSSSDQWRKHHGRLCYLDEAEFQAWLDRVTTGAGQQPGKTMQPDIGRTGAAGRPTIMHIIKSELVARAQRGELKPTLAAESELLRGWAAEKYPNAPTPKAKALQNSLRDVYRECAQRHPK